MIPPPCFIDRTIFCVCYYLVPFLITFATCWRQSHSMCFFLTRQPILWFPVCGWEYCHPGKDEMGVFRFSLWFFPLICHLSLFGLSVLRASTSLCSKCIGIFWSVWDGLSWPVQSLWDVAVFHTQPSLPWLRLSFPLLKFSSLLESILKVALIPTLLTVLNLPTPLTRFLSPF